MLFLLLLTAGCTTPGAPADEASYRAEIEQWGRNRIVELRQPDGWLTLAGLYWLDIGVNT